MIPTEHKEPSLFKIVVVGPEERVVGVHVIGMGSDELLQGFAVAVKMGGKQNTYRSITFVVRSFLMMV
jgi:glutathione reductase (NADPH)